MAFAETLAPFVSDFGVSATVGGIAVTGIFDSEYQDAFGITPAGRAALLCKTADVAAAAVDTAVVVNSVSYSVAEVQPDGTGMTRLLLK